MKINWETKKDGNIEITTFAAITPNGVVINPEFQEAYNKVKKDALNQTLVNEPENDKGTVIAIITQRLKDEFNCTPHEDYFNVIQELLEIGFCETDIINELTGAYADIDEKYYDFWTNMQYGYLFYDYAYEKGIDAYNEGLEKENSPYTDNDLSDAWLQGYENVED